MTKFMESQDSIYLPSFMSFSAVVSEICLLNGKKKKKNLEICSFQFNTSPSHITYCVVLQFKPELPYGHMFTLTKLELRKPQTESIISLYTQPMVNHGHPYIHSTTVLCDKQLHWVSSECDPYIETQSLPTLIRELFTIHYIQFW